VHEDDHRRVVRPAEVVHGDGDAATGLHELDRGGHPARLRWGIADPEDDHEAVRAANAAFYEAFEARDMDRMSDVWEHSDRVSCVHPGWGVLRGWGPVAASWFALFSGPQHLQFILTNESVQVDGTMGWVTVDEDLLDGEEVGGTVAALNVFVRGDNGRWLLVAHNGSAVATRT
jgi:ketosteroid isomerase-like protein